MNGEVRIGRPRQQEDRDLVQASTVNWGLADVGTIAGGEVEHGLEQKAAQCRSTGNPPRDWHTLPLSWSKAST